MTVRFDSRAPALPPASRKGGARLAALLTGCCVAVLPIASLPTLSRDAEREPPVRPERAVEMAAMDLALPAPAKLPVEPPEQAMAAPVAPPKPPKREPPAPPPARTTGVTTATEIPRIAVAPSAPPPLVVDLPDSALRLALADGVAALPAEPLAAPPLVLAQPAALAVPEPVSAPPAEVLRPVDVVQIADSEVRSLRVPQLNEPGLIADGEPDLSARIAAMQVTPPPPARLREPERAALLAEAPTRLTLRIGNSALGKVDFRMTDTRTIDVQLSGLLDLLAGHYDAAEFARLRTSAAADAYVSFDQLRALGLNVRYDPAYDELRING